MKYKNNKEHPIDNLFAQKLGNLESTPSENAWQALERGLSQKPRKKNKAIFWLPYVAAAAIALLVVSVWLLHQQTANSLNNTGLANNQLESRQEQKTTTTTPEKSVAKDETVQPPNNKAVEEQLAMQEKASTKENAKKETSNKEEVKAKKMNDTMADKKSDTPSTANEVTPKPIPKPTITPLENTVAQIERKEQPSVITPSSLTKDESTTIVVTVQLDEETEELGEEEKILAEETQKRSRAGKFFSTLKKIKKGDFDELGIRPETIVAYVKDRATTNNQSNEK